MDDNRDYIDLREDATQRVVRGNDAPPPVPTPAHLFAPPTQPARKGNVLITVVIVLSSLFVLFVLVSVLLGFVHFHNFTTTEMVQTHVATEILMAEMTISEIEEWARQLEIYAQEWARQLEVNAESWERDLRIEHLRGLSESHRMADFSSLEDLLYLLEYLLNLDNLQNP